MAFIKKRIDDEASFLYDRKEVVLAPMWSTATSSLFSAFTSSNQPHHQKIYYRNVYADVTKTGSLDVDFSISYGNITNSGSSTGSFGILTGSLSSSVQIFNPVSESLAVYSLYRNMLIDTVANKNNYLSDGKFKFYGLRDINYGTYEWGYFSESYAATEPIDEGERINIPDLNSSLLRETLSLSCARKESNPFGSRRFYFINKQGRLFQRAKSRPTTPSPISGNLIEMGIGYLWKQVSAGKNHIIAIREDGTLWAWGENNYGQLGLGYTSTLGSGLDNYFINIGSKTPEQIGTKNNWEKVYTGPDCSFAINSDGELYSWGWDSNAGILGLGGLNIEYYTPTKVGANTWSHIAVGVTDNANEIDTTVFGIDTSGKLWGWGDNKAHPGALGTRTKLSTSNNYESSPVLLNSDTDWFDIDCGRYHVIAIKGITSILIGWGYTGQYGELLASDDNTTSAGLHYTISNRKVLTDELLDQTRYGSGWYEVDCGSNYSFAVSSDRKLWGWGDNSLEQLHFDTGAAPEYSSVFYSPSNLTGWDKVDCGIYGSIGAINYPDTNVFSMTSDDIYVLNIERSNYKDKIDAGNWQISLRSANTGSGEQLLSGSLTPNGLITLVDESVNFDGTDYQHPMYDVTSKGGNVYSIYSGSLSRGIDKSAKNTPYGLFFPENGLMIFNGEMLRNTGSRNTITIQTRRTPATSSGAFRLSSNADLFYTSISGAMSVGFPFIANAVEVKHPTYAFVRINNEEYNYTLNRSYYSETDTYAVKDKLQTLGYPFTYITTIGLYNDNDDLLAVAKLSRPIKKTPSTELVIKVKLDI
jgi:alpha-tubulin suppressor-like RCC1 family protein